MDDKLGATGRFPQGKLNSEDKGELRIAIGEENGRVKILFGEDISWLAMSPNDAIKLGQAIIEGASRIKIDYGEVTEEEAMYLLLLLVDKDIPISVIATWTQEEKDEVGKWANKVLMKASDHKYIRISTYPEVLKRYDQSKTKEE